MKLLMIETFLIIYKLITGKLPKNYIIIRNRTFNGYFHYEYSIVHINSNLHKFKNDFIFIKNHDIVKMKNLNKELKIVSEGGYYYNNRYVHEINNYFHFEIDIVL